MLPINQNTSNSTANQRQNAKAVAKPLQLEPTDTEERIARCKKHIRYLKENPDNWSKDYIDFFLNYFQDQLEKYQNKIDTANAWLVNVSSPKFL